jgi:hypothetical protein
MNNPKSHPLSTLRHLTLAALACFTLYSGSVAHAADPLPSWNDGPAKKAILEFVAAVTDENGKDYARSSPSETLIATCR